MTTLNTQPTSGGWHVGRVAAQCTGCGAELPPTTVCWAALCDRPVEQLSPAEKAAETKSKKTEEKKPELSPFIRVDFCEKCWDQGKLPPEPLTTFSFWKTTVPVPETKKKLLVDDAVLVDVFARMEGKNEPQEIRFRFVLALILMRKRLLKYEGMESAPPSPTLHAGTDPTPQTPGPAPHPETWRMIPRGSDQPIHVINPHLTAEQITEVSQQLSAILAEEI